jgi:hypothetical protein
MHQRKLPYWCTLVWNSHQLIPNKAYSPQGRLLRKRQDSVFERDYVSTPTHETDVRPLVLKGHPNKPYRQHRLSSMYQILSFRSEGKFSARWYSLCTELHNVKIHDESVESVLAIPIRMRASS